MVAVVTGAGLGLAGASSSVLGKDGQVGVAATGRGGEGVYINARTGNLVVQHQDELLVGRGPDIGIVRTYNSGATFDFDNNDSWQLSLYRKLGGLTGTVNTSGSTLKRHGADGSQLTYAYDSTRGQYVNKDGGGAYDTLSYDRAGNSWTWTDGDTGLTETYAASGTAGEWRIAARRDADGNALAYAYDANGLISQVTDANGETTRLSYDAATRRLGSIQVMAGGITTTRIRYTYDASGRLATVVTDLAPSDNSIADGKAYTTTYAYDGTSKRIASIANSDGTRVSFAYDASGRVARVTDGLGQATTFTYNLGSTTVTAPLGQASTLSYDAAGNLTRLQGPAGSGQDVAYAYNAAGDLAQLKDSRGNAVAYAYDANGNLLRQQDSAGNVLERAYNGANQLVRQTAYALPDPDGAGAGQAASPEATHYIRDARQHLRFVVTPAGRVTEYRYDGFGQQVSSLVYAGAIFTPGATAPTEATLATWANAQDKTRLQRLDTAYDARGLATTVTRFARTDAAGAGVADGTQSTTRYIYDAAGRLLQQIDPRGVTTPGLANDYLTAYAYDGLGRTLSVTAYDSAGSAPRQTLTTFNDAANRIEVTLANGLKRLSTFDARGLLVSQVEQDGATALSTVSHQYDADGRLRVTTDPQGGKTYFLYDAGGRQVGEIDPAGSLTESIYNGNGQLIRTRRYATAVGASLASLFAPGANGIIPHVALGSLRPAATTSDPVERRLYDGAGRLRFVVDARGHVTETRYGGTGRVLAQIAYANALNNVAGLDGLGREAVPTDIQLLAAAPAGTQIGLRLDAANDRTRRHFHDADGLLRATLDGEGYLTEFQYDAAGRLTQTIRYGTVTDPAQRAAGSLAALVARANAAPAQNLVTFAYYDGLGQLAGSVDGEGYYTAYQYDLAGNRTRTTRYANRLVGTAVPGTAPRVVAAVPGSVPAGGYVLASAADQTSLAAWTAFNQLDTETAVDGTRTRHSYDAAGNLVKTVLGEGAADARSRQFRYDKQGRLIQELSALGAQALAALGAAPTPAQVDAVWAAYGTAHTYDAAGRRIRSIDANGNQTLFFYDAANRLTYSVRRVRNPTADEQRAQIISTPSRRSSFFGSRPRYTTVTVAAWLGEASARQYNALGQLTAEVRYANRITATAFATLTGGSEAQVKAAGIIVADAARDQRTDHAYQLTGQLARTTVKLNATQNAVTERFHNAFGELNARQSSLDAARTRREEWSYDRRGLTTLNRRDVAWGSNTGATGVSASAAYDAFGRAIRHTDGNGVVRTAAFDKLGREIQTVSAAGSLNLSRSATYDAFGRVLTQTDALGQVTRTAYAIDNASGRTTLTVTSPENIITRTVTDRHGQTVTVADGLGNETRSTYDANGNLLAVRRWNKAANTETTLESRSYDTAGLNLVTTRDANGNAVSYAYDANGRVLTRTVDAGGLNLVTRTEYDALGQAVRVTDPSGVVTQTTYDLAGRVIEMAIDPTGLNLRTRYSYDLADHRVTLVEGYGTTAARTTEYRYDSLGRRTQETVDPAGLKLTTTYAYDRNGNLVTRVEAAGTAIARTTRYAYDGDNRLVYTVDALGAVVKSDYDAEGRLLQTTAYARAIGLAGLATDPGAGAIAALIGSDAARDRITRHAYDRDGRDRFTIDALGAVTERQYDASGKLVRQVRYANALQGGLALGAAPAVAASAADRVTTYAHDALGRLTSRTEGAGTALARTETWGYDLAGNTVRHTDARGNQEWFAYDKANRLIRHIDQGGYVIDTAWNAGGTKQSEKRHMNAVALPATADDFWAYAGHTADPVANTDPVSGDRTTAYAYDKAGRLIQGTDAKGNFERYDYDALGNKTSFTNKMGATWTYGYDAAGRQVSEQSPLVTVTSVSDALAVSTAQVSLETRIQYDALNNVIARTEAHGRPEARTTRYEHDAVGHQVKTIHPLVGVYGSDDLATNGIDGIDGTVARTEESATPTVVVTYDTLGRAVVNRDAAGAYSYKVYDALDRLQYEVDAEHYLTEYRYDRQGNTTQVIRYAKALVLDFARSRAMTASDVAGLIVASDADRSLINEYDALDRVVKVTEPAAYNFDPSAPAGSQYFMAGRITTKTYNAAGQLVQQRVLKNPLTDIWAETTFYYDSRGNKTAQIDALGYLTTWKYDGAGNVVRQVEYAKALGAGTWNLAGYGVPAATTPHNSPNSAIGYDRETRYQYDRKNQKIAETRVNVEYATTPGALAANAVFGDLTTRYAYDWGGNLVSITDATGARTQIDYDRLGRKQSVWAPDWTQEGSGEIPSFGHLLTGFSLDAYGNVVGQSDWAAVPSGYIQQGKHSHYFYDAHGHVIRTVDPEGNSKYTSYDILGRVAKEWQPITDNDGVTQNVVRVFQYDRLGRQTATIEPSYQPNQTLGASSQQPAGVSTSADFVRTQVRYNAFGEISAKGINDGWQESYEYDKAGRLWRSKGQDGVTKVYLFDAQGNTTAEIQSQQLNLANYAGPADIAQLFAEVQRTETHYDLLGRAVQHKAPAFTLDRATSGTLTDTSSINPALETIQPVVSQTLDRWGNILSVTDPRNAAWVTTSRYDGENRLLEQRLPAVDVWGSNGLATTGTPTTRTYYDAAGRAIATVDANGNTSTVRYNRGGHKTIEYHADGGVVRHLYDGFGREVRTVDANGNVIKYQYDRNDRLVMQWNSISQNRYAYDAAGNRIRETNAVGQTVSYWYDTRGKVIRTRQPLGQETTYAYDARGNKTREVNANGDVATWNYDYAGHVLGHVDLGGATYRYTYNYTGQLLTQTNTRGQNLAYSYYENGLLKSIGDNVPQLVLSAGGGVSILGSSITKTGGVNGSWDADAYSQAGMTGGAYVSARPGQTNMYGMFGLNSDPTADRSYTSLDYAWYTRADGVLEIRENGASIATFGSYTTTDILSIVYEGSTVRYLKNGQVQRTVGTTAGRTFHFDSSLYHTGFTLNAIQFGPNFLTTTGGVTLNGDSIVKSGGANYSWDSDAYSKAGVTGGAYVSARAGQTNLFGMFGLNSDPTADRNFTSLDYAWYTHGDGNLYIYENGTPIGAFGPYTTSDVLSIVYEGTTVNYLKNGVVQRTVSTTAGRSFHFDSSLYSTSFVFNDIKFGANLFTSGGSVTINGDSLTKTGGTNGSWDSDAYSKTGVTGGAYVSARAGQTNLHGMFGLNSDPTADRSYTSLDYAWYPAADGKLYIYENGTRIGVFGNFGSYTINDVLSITYDGANVRYLKNGVVMRTVATTADRSFHFDSSFYSTGYKLDNIEFGAFGKTETLYVYDAAGNRTWESHTKAGTNYQDARITFDAHGRVVRVEDNQYTLNYSYDANGNRRRIQSRYYDENNIAKTTDDWYLYDRMNRITVSQGILAGGSVQTGGGEIPILQGTTGTTISGGSITKTAAGSWTNVGPYSQNGFTGSAYVSAVPGQVRDFGCFGLNSDPATDNSFTSLDYAWGIAPGGKLFILESNQMVGNVGTYSTTDILSITYDGSNIHYKQNGVVKRTVATTSGRTFYFDSSFYNTGFQLNDVRFGAYEPKGIQLSYDAAGNRRTATSYQNGALVSESYTYDANNRLLSTARNGSTTSARSYDAAGRVTEQMSYSSPGTVSERRTTIYDSNGRVTEQQIYNASNSLTQRVSYTGYDQLGNVLSYKVSVYQGTSFTNTYTYTYAKFDSYKETRVAGTSTYFQPGATTTTYDVNGNIVAVSETFATSKNRSFVTDQSGQILRENQNGKVQNHFYAGGKPVGSAGALSAANFDYNYTPVSDLYPATAPTSYVVSAGDTLRGIALAVFGDAQLWYLIADANGLKSDADLKAGQTLSIPNKVTNLRNAYDTFKPYAPGEIIGDTTPTLPDPPPPPAPKKKGGCGGAGMIIVAIVAIVATVMTAGALAGMAAQGLSATWTAGMGALGLGASAASASIGTAMIAGAVGSMVSQGVAMAMGLQEKFSWSGVAMGAVGAGVTAGIAGAATSGGALSALAGETLGATVGRAVLGNALTQGIGVVTGQQNQFSWTGVAVAAVGAGVSKAIGDALPANFGTQTGTFDKFARDALAGLGGGVARQVVYGGRANWASLAADGFGNALANALVAGLSAKDAAAQQVQELDRGRGNGVGNAIGSLIEDVTVGTTGGGSGLTLRNGDGIQVNLKGGDDLISYASPDYALDGGGMRLATQVGDRFSYTVQSGDTLTGIAQANGRQLGELLAVNRLSNPNLIREGQDIIIPAGGVVPLDVSRSVEGQFYRWNAQQEAIAANNVMGTDGMRVGPTIARAQAMGIYSGNPAPVIGTPFPNSPMLSAWDGVSGTLPTQDQINQQRILGGLTHQMGRNLQDAMLMEGGGILLGMGGKIATRLFSYEANAAFINGVRVEAGAVTTFAGAGARYNEIISSVNGRVVAQYTALDSGPLSASARTAVELQDSFAATFSGGRYAEIELTRDTVAYRAWHPDQAKEFGAFWSLEKPAGSLRTRIDSALLPEWGKLRSNPVLRQQATQYTEVLVPKGTRIYLGEVGSQGGSWTGGGSQFLIKDGSVLPAWKIGGGSLK